MANRTVYPYGTDGQLPSGIGIINDLTTGGADKALSAEMGKELNDKIEGELVPVPVSLTPYPEKLGTLGTIGWYTTNNVARHIAVPVSPGEKYKLLVTSGGSGSFYGFVDSTYAPPTANDQPVPYVGQTERSWLGLDTPIDLIVPIGGAYLILVMVDGGSVSHTWELYRYEREGGVEELVPIVQGVPTSVVKAISFLSLALAANSTRIYTVTKEKVAEGCVINASLSNYSTFELIVMLISQNTWGTGTEIWSSGWGSANITHIVTAAEAGNYVRITVRRPNDGLMNNDVATVTSLLSYTAVQNETKNVGGLAQYVGEPIDTLDNEIDLTGLTVQNCSLGSGGWYMSGAAGRHIAAPVTAGKSYRISKVGGSSENGIYGFMSSSYNPPYANGDVIPYAPNCSREFLGYNSSVVVTAPEGAAYLVLCTVDGNGATSVWELTEKTKIVKKTIFEEIEALKDEMTNVEASAGFGKLRIASYNVGHFALGTADDTKITHANYATMRQKWAEAINDIHADIFGACEYNTNFVNAGDGLPAITARDSIFANYAYAAIGAKYSYNQNSILSNLPLVNITSVNFTDRTQSRYYIVGEITIGSKTVKVVETHLDWNEGGSGATNRAAQIQQLISDFAGDDYVIIGADFNVASESEFDAFVSAGYQMANHGYLGDLPTYPAGNPTIGIDNIVCKGFAISDINILNDDTISDHCAVYADLTMI